MDLNEARVGVRVRSLRHFSGIPAGTEGVIDEQYDGGFMVAWDRAEAPLPAGYSAYDGRWMIETGILRDGFSHQELVYLEPVR